MTSKITIQGVPPAFDQVELEQRQAGYHTMYSQTSQCMEIVRAVIPYEFLVAITEKVKLGYVISPKQPITAQPLDYSAYLIKPEAIQQADLEILDEQIKQEYIAWLESEHARYKELLTEQLLLAAEVKEKQKEETKRTKLLESIRTEVNDAYGEELVLP